jgi:putative flippase GtrA
VSVAGRARAQRRAAWGRQFSVLMAAIVARFPLGLARIVPPTLLGFAVISGITFSVDLALLTLIHGLLGWPLPAGLTLAYLTASGLGYLLNRALNFRSHAAVGPQAAVYTVVVIINYLVCILGVGTGLAALGVDYRLARAAGACCEIVYMYTALRFVVFRDVQRRDDPGPPAGSSLGGR